MKIGALFTEKDACFFYRAFQPLEMLKHNGHEVVYYNSVPDEVPDIDIFYVTRVGSPDGLLPWSKWRFRAGKPRIVFDMDDNLFALPDQHPAKWSNSIGYYFSLVSAIEDADLVTVATPALQEALKLARVDHTAVLQNTIEPGLLQIPRQTIPGKLVIGYEGGIGHEQDLELIAPALRYLLDSYPDQVEMHFMGADYRKVLGPVDAEVRYTPWCEISEYYGEYDFDIALAPLADLPFNHYKSHIRVLEAMSRGSVVLASNREPYKHLINHMFDGYLVEDNNWHGLLNHVVMNESVRKVISSRTKRKATQWTTEAHWQEWEKAFLDLL